MLQFCAYESRERDQITLKLLALSLARFAPNAELYVFCSGIPAETVTWLETQDNTRLIFDYQPHAGSWDIKPELLLELLARGVKAPIWIDSDIIVSNFIEPFFEQLDHEEFVVAELPDKRNVLGMKKRADLVGLDGVRDRGFNVNSCIVRATAQHRDILLAWQKLLLSESYQAVQALPPMQRPKHMMGDQGMLSAVLGSRDFADVPVRALTQGTEIAQLHARQYGVSHRVGNAIRGAPMFTHAQTVKPWRDGAPNSLVQKLSPYRLRAREYSPLLKANECNWMYGDPALARLYQLLTFSNPDLSGVPDVLRVNATHAGARVLNKAKRMIAGAPRRPG